ncbi:hypothetical protein I6A94_27870, partial [Frankia sp. CN4]|nr:hypothetical protein [Frankia nepalensis]
MTDLFSRLAARALEGAAVAVWAEPDLAPGGELDAEIEAMAAPAWPGRAEPVAGPVDRSARPAALPEQEGAPAPPTAPPTPMPAVIAPPGALAVPFGAGPPAPAAATARAVLAGVTGPVDVAPPVMAAPSRAPDEDGPRPARPPAAPARRRRPPPVGSLLPPARDDAPAGSAA